VGPPRVEGNGRVQLAVPRRRRLKVIGSWATTKRDPVVGRQAGIVEKKLGGVPARAAGILIPQGGTRGTGLLGSSSGAGRRGQASPAQQAVAWSQGFS